MFDVLMQAALRERAPYYQMGYQLTVPCAKAQYMQALRRHHLRV